MHVRRGPRVAVAVASMVGMAVGLGPAVATVSSLRWGWWTGASPLAYPDVPRDGLVVQGGLSAGSPLAYSALAFEVGADASVRLRLSVAPGSVSTPGALVAACPLTTTSFSPAQGGSLADAPPFDCGTQAVVGPNAEGSEYSLDVTSFQRGGVVAIAILPMAASDRVVFTAPTAGSLEVARGSRTVSGSAAATFGPTEPGMGTALEGDGSENTPALALSGGAGLPSAITGPAPPVAGAPEASLATGTSENSSGASGLGRVAMPPAAGVVAADEAARSGTGTALFGGLALLAAVLWFLAGRGWEEPRPGEVAGRGARSRGGDAG